jgi:hypothetical protein
VLVFIVDLYKFTQVVNKMEQPLGVRLPFNQATMQQADIKERFYRYFQEEVTGRL